MYSGIIIEAPEANQEAINLVMPDGTVLVLEPGMRRQLPLASGTAITVQGPEVDAAPTLDPILAALPPAAGKPTMLDTVTALIDAGIGKTTQGAK
jgi:hypothetical protein